MEIDRRREDLCIVAAADYNDASNKRVYFGNDGGIYTTADVSKVGNDANPPRVSGWVSLVQSE